MSRLVLFVALAAIVCTATSLPVPDDPKVSTLPLSSDNLVARALGVISSRLERGRKGSAVGFNLIDSFVTKKQTAVSRKIEDFKSAINSYQKHITYLEEVILTSKRDKNDVETALSQVKQNIIQENVNPRVLFQAAQVIDKHQQDLLKGGAISLIEIEELKAAAIPDDKLDSTLQKLKQAEAKAEEAAKASDTALENAKRKLKDAQDSRHLAHLKRLESSKARLEYLVEMLKTRISVSQTGITKTKQDIKTVEDAISRHQFIVQVIKKLNSDLSTAQASKQKVYDRQINSVNSVEQAFKLSLDLAQFKIDDGFAAPTKAPTQKPIGVSTKIPSKPSTATSRLLEELHSLKQ